jgi:hypothetical protein
MEVPLPADTLPMTHARVIFIGAEANIVFCFRYAEAALKNSANHTGLTRMRQRI